MKMSLLFSFFLIFFFQKSWGGGQCKQLVNEVDGACIFAYKYYADECPVGWYKGEDKCEEILKGKIKPSTGEVSTPKVESKEFSKDFCQIDSMIVRCPACETKRKFVICYTDQKVIRGFVEYDASVIQAGIDGKVTKVTSTASSVFDSKEIPEAQKVRVFSFNPGTKIFGSEDKTDQNVIYTISDQKGDAPKDITDFGRRASDIYEFNCISKGKNLSRCIGYAHFPENTLYAQYQSHRYPVVYEKDVNKGCNVDSLTLMSKLWETRNEKGKLPVTTISGNNELVNGEVKSLVKPYSIKLDYKEKEISKDLSVTYEKNSFFVEKINSSFTKFTLGKYDITVTELVEVAEDKGLKDELKFVPRFSEIQASVLKDLIFKALLKKNVNEKTAKKLVNGDVLVTPGDYFYKDGNPYTKNTNAPIFYLKSDDDPVSVCPGAKKLDYFIHLPVEINTPLCDEMILIGESQNQNGEIKMLGCFSSTQNPVYCAKPSICEKDGYSDSRQKFVVEKVIGLPTNNKTPSSKSTIEEQ